MPSEAFAHLARRFEGEDFQDAEHSFRLCRQTRRNLYVFGNDKWRKGRIAQRHPD
jgi:hypothetical protein